MSKNLLYTSIILLGFSSSQAQYSQNVEKYQEIGIMAGPVYFQSDYGQRGNFENYIKQNGFSIGAFYYISFDGKSKLIRENLKFRLEASYMKSDLQHYGKWVDPSKTSLIAQQLRAMRGSTQTANLGLQVEYYPFRTDDYCYECKLSPYVSLGTQISNILLKHILH